MSDFVIELINDLSKEMQEKQSGRMISPDYSEGYLKALEDLKTKIKLLNLDEHESIKILAKKVSKISDEVFQKLPPEIVEWYNQCAQLIKKGWIDKTKYKLPQYPNNQPSLDKWIN